MTGEMMTRTHNISLAIAALILVSLPTASAQPRPQTGSEGDTLVSQRTRGARVLKRGSVASLRTRQVDVGGGRKMSVGSLATLVFADQDQIARELRGARSSLLSDPVVSDEVVETDEATVLTRRTRAVVTDPAGLARRARRFNRMRKRASRARFRDITGASRQRFAAWKKKLSKLPANHPLRIAAGQGDDALIAAVQDGKGDIEVTTTVVIPKKQLEIVNGQLLVPRYRDGKIDYKSKSGRRLRSNTSNQGTDRARDAKPSRVNKTGEVNYTAKFLSGWTLADSWEWSRTWKFPSGFFRVKADAYYSVGLRVPLKVHARMTPRKVTVRGASDVGRKFKVELTAEAVDANAAYYKDTGLPTSEIHKGKELVLEAGFHLHYTIKAGWGVIKMNGRIGKDFDFGKNFRAPLGSNCSRSGSSCGVEVWIPSSLTGTGLKIGTKKLYIKGAAEAGFLLGGTGTIRATYKSLYGNGAKSQRRGTSAWRASHELRFTSGAKQVLTTKLPALARPGSRSFGFSLSKPSYAWAMTLTPGVRVTIDVVAGKWINKQYVVGPMWIRGLAMKLGTLKLPRHKGSNGTYRVRLGTKTFIKK